MQRTQTRKRRSWWKWTLLSIVAVLVAIWLIGGTVKDLPQDMIDDSKNEMLQNIIKESKGNITGGNILAKPDNTMEVDMTLVSGYEYDENTNDATAMEQRLVSKENIDKLNKDFTPIANEYKIDHLTLVYKYFTSTGELYAKASIPLSFK